MNGRPLAEELTARTKTEVCASCAKPLTVAWYDNTYRLRCPAHGYDIETRVKREPGLRERFERGNPLDSIEMMTLEKILKKEMLQQD